MPDIYAQTFTLVQRGRTPMADAVSGTLRSRLGKGGPPVKSGMKRL
jgi:hypothetical protein